MSDSTIAIAPPSSAPVYQGMFPADPDLPNPNVQTLVVGPPPTQQESDQATSEPTPAPAPSNDPSVAAVYDRRTSPSNASADAGSPPQNPSPSDSSQTTKNADNSTAAILSDPENPLGLQISPQADVNPQDSAALHALLEQAQADQQDSERQYWLTAFTDPAWVDRFQQSENVQLISTLGMTPEEISHRAITQDYIEEQAGFAPGELQSGYSILRGAFAEANFGDPNLTDQQLYQKLGRQLQAEQATCDALNELPGDFMVGAVDALEQGQPIPSTPQLLQQWKDRHPEVPLAGQESALLQQAQAMADAQMPMLQKYGSLVKDVYDTTAGFSRVPGMPVKSQDDIYAQAEPVAALPDDVQQWVNQAVATYASRKAPPAPSGLLATGQKVGTQVDQSVVRSVTVPFQAAELAIEEGQLNSEMQTLQGVPPPSPKLLGQDFANDYGESALPLSGAQKAARMAEIRKRLSVLQAARGLFRLARGAVKPIRPVFDGPAGAIENSAYGLTQALPLLATTAFEPEIGIPLAMTAFSTTEYDRVRSVHPHVPIGQAQAMGAISGSVQGLIMGLTGQNVLGKLPITGRWLKSLATPSATTLGAVGKYTAKSALMGGELAVQNEAQLATPMLIDGLAKALHADLPEYDWKKELSAFAGAQPQVLASILPLWLIGGGALGLRDVKMYRDIANNADVLAAKTGIDAKAAAAVARETDLAKQDALFRAAWAAVPQATKDAMIAAADAHARAAAALNDDPHTPTLHVVTQPDGSQAFAVTDSRGNEVFRTRDIEAANKALQLQSAHEGIVPAGLAFSKQDPVQTLAQALAKVTPLKPRTPWRMEQGGEQKVIERAKQDYIALPLKVQTRDGRTVFLKHNRQGTADTLFQHLITTSDKRTGETRVDRVRAAWIPRIAQTLEEARVRVPLENGNHLYVMPYDDGHAHFIVVKPDNTLGEQGSVDDLWTQWGRRKEDLGNFSDKPSVSFLKNAAPMSSAERRGLTEPTGNISVQSPEDSGSTVRQDNATTTPLSQRQSSSEHIQTITDQASGAMAKVFGDRPKPDVVVHADPESIPDENLRKAVQAEDAKGKGLVEAFLNPEDGKIHILASRVSSDRVEATVRHEALHWALRTNENFRSDYEQLMGHFAATLPADTAASLRARYGDDHVRVMEEYMAHLAETEPKGGVWRKFVVGVKTLLAKWFPQVKFSPDDIREFMRSRMSRASSADDLSNNNSTGNLASGPQFSLGKDRIHNLAKPTGQAYKNEDDQARDPASVLSSLVRGDAGATTGERGKYGRQLASHSSLVAWAEEHGRILRNPGVFSAHEGTGGGEHGVVEDPATGRIFKLTKPGLHGAQAEDAGAYLQRLALGNRIFGDDVKFEGMIRMPGEDDRTVISQPFVKGRDATTEEQNDYLRGRGFAEINGKWIHPIMGVKVWDTITPGNMIVKPDGTVQPIDLQVEPASSGELRAAREISGQGLPTSFATDREGTQNGDGGEGEDVNPQSSSPASPTTRASADEQTARWQRMLQGIAPRAAKELALKVQSRAEAAAKIGDVPEAAQAAIHNKTIYLFSEALDAYAKVGNERTEGVRRLLHEVGHAWWDTLPESEKTQLTQLWQQETSGKTGPLYENGQLRPEVMAGTESDPQEWFAERTAMANDAWAQKRAAIADHDGSLLGRISARLRGWLFDAMQTLKPKWSQDAMTQKFRDAMRRDSSFGETSNLDARFVSARDASYKDVDRQWWKDFADWKDGRLPAPHVFNFGPASDELKAGGFPDGDIRLTQRVLSSKPDQDNHPFPRALFFNLPRNLRDPIMVFRSKSNPDARTVLTELKHDGKNLLVAVHFVPVAGGLEISNIASVYPKDAGSVVSWIREDLATYYDKEKAYNWLSHNSARSNSSQTWVHLQATKNIKNDDDIVKGE